MVVERELVDGDLMRWQLMQVKRTASRLNSIGDTARLSMSNARAYQGGFQPAGTDCW